MKKTPLVFFILGMLWLTFTAATIYTPEGHTKYYIIQITPTFGSNTNNILINFSLSGTDCANDPSDVSILYLNATKKEWNFTNVDRTRVVFVANDTLFAYKTQNGDYSLFCNTTSAVTHTGSFIYAHDYDDNIVTEWTVDGGTVTASTTEKSSSPYSLKWLTADSTNIYTNHKSLSNDTTWFWSLNIPSGSDSQHCSWGFYKDPLASRQGLFLCISGGDLRWYNQTSDYVSVGNCRGGAWGSYALNQRIGEGIGNISDVNGVKYAIDVTPSISSEAFGTGAGGISCYLDNFYIYNGNAEWSNTSTSLGGEYIHYPTTVTPNYGTNISETQTRDINISFSNSGITNISISIQFNGTYIVPTNNSWFYNFTITMPLVQTNLTKNYVTVNYNVSFTDSSIESSTHNTAFNVSYGYYPRYFVYENPTYLSTYNNIVTNLFAINNITATTNIFLNYSGQLYDTSTPSNNNYTATFSIPTFSGTNINNNFNAIVNLSFNGISVERNYFNASQFVTKIILTNCSNATFENSTTINITLFSEDWLTTLTGDVDVTFQIYTTNTSIYNNYTFQFRDASNYRVCVYPSNANYSANAIMHYAVPAYSPRNYYLYNTRLTNTTYQINLYSMNVTKATAVLMKVVDEDDNPIEGLLVKTLRYYPDLNLYNLVEVSRTDSNGYTTASVELNSRFYKFLLERNNILYLESNTALITTSTINWLVKLSGYFLDNFNRINNIASSMTYNNITRTFAFTWSDSNGIVDTARLKVINLKSSGETTLCTNQLSASSGTLLCTLPAGNYTGTVTGTGYIDTNTKYSEHPLRILNVEFPEILVHAFGAIGAFVAALILLTVGFASQSPKIMIVMSIFGLIVVTILGFSTLSLGATIALSILGMLYLYMGRS